MRFGMESNQKKTELENLLINNKDNKTFCMAPWTHMNIGPNGDVYPCCLMPLTDIEDTSCDEDGNVTESVLEVIASECNGDSRDFKMGSLLNESLRDIKIIRPEFIKDLVSSYKKSIRG